MIDIFASPWINAPQPMPTGTEAFAVGDVHGRADLLDALLTALPQHCVAADTQLVFLGDLIDRGPDSRRCLALAATAYPWASNVHRLMGNHEQLMIGSLQGLQIAQGNWAINGGFDTLRSFGVDVYTTREPIEALSGRLSSAERRFLDNLQMEIRIGPYVFVHAGWHPDVAPDQQSDDDRLWIRRTFLEAATWRHPFTVVHGHTPQRPGIDRHRIGVDSKAYQSGVLTAVQIAGQSVRFVQAFDAAAHDTRVLLQHPEA